MENRLTCSQSSYFCFIFLRVTNTNQQKPNAFNDFHEIFPYLFGFSLSAVRGIQLRQSVDNIISKSASKKAMKGMSLGFVDSRVPYEAG